MTRKPSRRGAALILVVVCLAVFSIMMTVVVQNGLAQKRFLQRRENQAQAYWLAQAGIEQGAARLLANPREYSGETFALIPGSEVRILMERLADSPDRLTITSEATFANGDKEPASSAASRTFILKQQNGTNVLIAVSN
jgi:Tfp pilus assembly protein PilX